jgi:hypothetical protein
MISVDVWKQARQHPGRHLTSGYISSLVKQLFDAPDAEVVGIRLPFDGGAAFDRIDRSVFGFYVWDPVTEQAFPRSGDGSRYMSIRVVHTSDNAARSAPQPSPVPEGTKRRGGISPTTRNAIEVLAGYCHYAGLPEEPSQRKLAQLAIEWGEKNGYDTTGLEIDGGAMRAVCQAFIDGHSRLT